MDGYIYIYIYRYICCTTTSDTATEKYEYTGKWRFFRFPTIFSQIYPLYHLHLNGTVEYIQPHILQIKKMVTGKTNYILDTPSTVYTQQAFTHASRFSPYVFNACEQSCIMMIMRDSSMQRAEHDPKTALYLACHTHQRLQYQRRINLS